ncbi:MAG: trehalose-phosphatase [Sorangiineae bacterium NIC37A_2]|jgi:trehalose 6-phosphate phosphatase|nr:MAG: trehalose-phosphatase [Sorangiineae bacterium NIC37A_2]
MKHLFHNNHSEILRALTKGRALLAFDFDGTLAPIVKDRGSAKMRPETAASFKALCRKFPCAVISGRGLSDLKPRLQGARVKYVIGNHGIEPSPEQTRYRRDMREALGTLKRALADLVGVDIEDKKYSLAIHYRRSPNKRSARQQIKKAIEALPVDVRLVTGKLVLNVVPEGAPHKGDALKALCKAERARACLYVGDDVTDEDVFRLTDLPGLIKLRIGASRSGAADYYLRDQRAIDALLAKLLDLGDKAAGP